MYIKVGSYSVYHIYHNCIAYATYVPSKMALGTVSVLFP